MATQKQRSESTRAKLVKAFRKSFLRYGYDATSVEKVLSETGLSKGALYHHFRSKIEIAEAIYTEESRRAIERALQSVNEGAPPLVRLRNACVAWLSEVKAPQVSKILFDVGPSALGQQRAKRIEDSFSLSAFEGLLKEAADDGEITLAQPALTARLLNALVAEAALYNLSSKDDAVEGVSRAIEGIFETLRT